MYETLLINGTNIADLVACVTSLDGLYQIGTPRGENIVIPGVDGETWVDKPYQTTALELGVTLAGATTAQFNDSLRALRTLVQPGSRLSLTRRLSYSAGDEEHIATGEYLSGLSPVMQLMRFGKTTLGLKIHDGIWHDSATRTLNVTPGTFSVAGETRTHRMTLTMPIGTTLTNTTTGHSVTNTVESGGTVLVDVETMTATQDGVDVSSFLSWTKRYPMRLAPGANVFTGTTSTIVYRAAYL